MKHASEKGFCNTARQEIKQNVNGLSWNIILIEKFWHVSLSMKEIEVWNNFIKCLPQTGAVIGLKDTQQKKTN